MADILQITFLGILIQISLKFVPKIPHNNVASISSDNGLVLNRKQAIIWTNNGLVYQGTYMSVGINELSI